MKVDFALIGNIFLREIANFVTLKKKIKQKVAMQSKCTFRLNQIVLKKNISSSKNRLKEN